jgi:hypothetical protein
MKGAEEATGWLDPSIRTSFFDLSLAAGKQPRHAQRYYLTELSCILCHLFEFSVEERRDAHHDLGRTAAADNRPLKNLLSKYSTLYEYT